MTTIKTFNYKGQMINYYNKARKNSNIDFIIGYYSAYKNTYVVEYRYKK